MRSSLHQQTVLHADETPVAMLSSGKKATHKAYIWAYTSTPFAGINTVLYGFAPNRAGENARQFLQNWKGKLVCDDFSGYKASFRNGITEIGYRVDEDVTALIPHRPGRAQLRHPVLHGYCFAS